MHARDSREVPGRRGAKHRNRIERRSDGKITVTLDGETVEGRYENLDPYRVTEENFVVYFGHNECRMTVGETVYGDGTSRPTLVLSGDGFAAYFYGKAD